MPWGTEIAASAVAGAALTEGVRLADRWFSSRRKEMNGTWYQILGATQEVPERVDIVELRQSGRTLEGTIRRRSPHSETQKRWVLNGYKRGNTIVAIFYPSGAGEDPSSYGGMILHRDERVKGALWRGYYTRPDQEPLDAVISMNSSLTKWPICWQRSHPDK